MVDAPAPVEELAHLDARSGLSPTPWPCGDVEDHSSQPNRIIVAHLSLIAEAADPIDIEPLGQCPPGALAFSGWLGKARIEIGFERAVNKQGSVLRCADSCNPELLN
jgi:hypothetical protein